MKAGRSLHVKADDTPESLLLQKECARRVLWALYSPSAVQRLHPGMTARVMRTLRMRLAGFSHEELACAYSCSVKTIRKHENSAKYFVWFFALDDVHAHVPRFLFIPARPVAVDALRLASELRRWRGVSSRLHLHVEREHAEAYTCWGAGL